LWQEDEKGFGYISDTLPELAMAVLPEYRGQGIGTQLLANILELANTHYPAVSLNVRADNPAVRLYTRAGFRKVPGSETINRVGGISFNMIYEF
jgi:GNAT superfamily N-acetyltransferase